VNNRPAGSLCRDVRAIDAAYEVDEVKDTVFPPNLDTPLAPGSVRMKRPAYS